MRPSPRTITALLILNSGLAMYIQDSAAVTSRELTPEGFLKVKANIGRAGLHDYRAAELGVLEGFGPDDRIRVYRPPEEVFDPASMASFAGKPVTSDHPPEMVDARNWRRYAIGQSGEQVMRDGDHMAAELLITDAGAVARAQGGAQLSNGYQADFDFVPGTAPDGTAYHAIQRNIRGNHIALVDAGRCGDSCRVGDCAGGAPRLTTVTVGGV
ncbi:MAG: DUF2213 domain-containing protein, partial [Parafilimonas terrae]|nr:DUF2213 domain-containing protein [Parafilimonas terrae]